MYSATPCRTSSRSSSRDTKSLRLRSVMWCIPDPVCTALVVLVCCTLASAAPTPKDDLLQDQWWYNTCDSHSVQQTRHQQHHASCTQLGDHVLKTTKRRLRTQMKVFMGDFQRDLRSINKTYFHELSGFAKYTKPAFDFLPKWKRSPEKSKVLLKNFHTDLQKYVVALHHLSTVKLSSDIEMWSKVQPKRKALLLNISQHTKRLLCEVETAVNNSCQAVPDRIPASYALDQGLTRDLKSFSELCLQDLGILNRFYAFMKDCSRTLVRNLPHKGKNTPKQKQKQQKPKQQKPKQKPKRTNNKKTSKSKQQTS